MGSEMCIRDSTTLVPGEEENCLSWLFGSKDKITMPYLNIKGKGLRRNVSLDLVDCLVGITYTELGSIGSYVSASAAQEAWKAQAVAIHSYLEYHKQYGSSANALIYTPVEGGKVPMRPVMSAEAARALAEEVPQIQPEEHRARTIQLLTQHYQSILQSGSSRDLLELAMSIQAKRRQAEKHNRRLGMVDERYGRQAERLLFGELAAALDLPYDQVPAFLFARKAAKV